jgi:ribonuclease P protein component
VVVSRKVGKAVVRNRVRRRLREAMLALLRTRLGLVAEGAAARRPSWPASFDIVVIARPSAAEASYAELATALATAVDRAVASGGASAAASSAAAPSAAHASTGGSLAGAA